MKVRGFQPIRQLGGGKGRRSERELMLRYAWSVAKPAEQRQFLSEVVDDLFRDGPRQSQQQARRATSRDGELAEFFAGNVVKTSRGRVQSLKLLERLNAWCLASDRRPWSSVLLARALKARGFSSEKSRVIWWLGLELSAAAPPPVPPPTGASVRNPRRERESVA